MALAPEFNHGFISDGKANAVLMFDLKTMKVLAEIASPKDPDGIIYDAASKRIFAFNGDSNSATVIDARSRARSISAADPNSRRRRQRLRLQQP